MEEHHETHPFNPFRRVPVATLRGQLRARLSRGSPILVLPGAADALTARILEDTGFEAVYATGAGIANTHLGVPDLGLVTMTETTTNISRIADAVGIPVVVDADTGYGGPLNVFRTVHELDRIGVAAVQLEDQVDPKRCGHFDNKAVILADQMLAKIRAALDARSSPDLLVIARTDARAVLGLDEAVRRGRLYADAGADIVFVEAPESFDEISALPKLIDAPLLLNIVEGGRTPMVDANTLEQLGYSVVLYANTALRVGVKAVQQAMRQLLVDGSSANIIGSVVEWSERQRLVRYSDFLALDSRY